MTYNDDEEGLIKAAYKGNLTDVETNLKNATEEIRPGVRLRALYISARKNHDGVFKRLLQGPGDSYLEAWRRSKGPAPVSQMVLCQVIKYLLDVFEICDVYVRDIDGQCLLHYVAKDGEDELFEYMIKGKYYNPLVRDRDGRTAWELAETKPPLDWIFRYILKEYENLSQQGSKILGVVCFRTGQEPSDRIRFSPKQFFSDSNAQWNEANYRLAQESLKGNSELVWVNLDINDDTLFTAVISKICKWKGYNEDDIANILKFHANTFFEQYHDDPWLKFREPWYCTTEIHLKDQGEDTEITSITFPYFDSGDLESGENNLKSYFQQVMGTTPSTDSEPDLETVSNLKRWSTNVHVQRNLDASYFIGLSSEQLKNRDRRDISEALPAKTKKHMLISQLWLCTFKNVVITASPREKPRRSHLFDHTLSQLRDTGLRAREGLTRNHLTVWILSECIHRLDPPCMADLKEPIFSFLGNSIADIFHRVQKYMKDKGIENMKITTEKEYIDGINLVRRNLPMLKNILSQQERIWDMLKADFKSRAEPTSNQETIARIKGITRRPDMDFVRFEDRIRIIHEDAENVEKYILVELDLKNKHASLRVSRYSTGLGILAAAFAVITIIFAPLSFLTSLFALPIAQFQSHQFNHTSQSSGSSNPAYRSDYILGWMVLGEGASIVFTAVFIVAVLEIYHRWQKSSSDSPASTSQNRAKQNSAAGSQMGSSRSVHNPAKSNSSEETSDAASPSTRGWLGRQPRSRLGDDESNPGTQGHT